MKILVTGANRGIGAAFTEAARAAGHEVVTATRPGKGGDLTFDVTDRAAIEAAAATLGPIDALLNNAGIVGPNRQATLDMDFEGFLETLKVNTLGPLMVAQAFLPNLRGGTTPKILSVSSQMSWMGYGKSDRIAYRASKSALNKVMQGLATDLKPEGIAVGVFDPGWARTDMGGPEADLDPMDVAKGLVGVFEKMTIADTGAFFTWRGDKREY